MKALDASQIIINTGELFINACKHSDQAEFLAFEPVIRLRTARTMNTMPVRIKSNKTTPILIIKGKPHET